jgi:hypothetical protein
MLVRKRRPNHRRVKRLRSYTVEETARLLGIHKNTVHAWIDAGLPTSDRKRPILILGYQLVLFLQTRCKSRKQPCRPGELYCFRCRAPRIPAGNMADYVAVTEKVGNLTAICPKCESIMNQRVSLPKLEAIQAKLEVAFPLAPRRLSESNQPSVNSDLRDEVRS